jgi:hypothetical protein
MKQWSRGVSSKPWAKPAPRRTGKNARVEFGRAQARRDYLRDSVRSADTAVALANDRYRSGIADFLQVLDAQRTQLLLQEQRAVSETRCATAFAPVHKALGGGWDPPFVRSRAGVLVIDTNGRLRARAAHATTAAEERLRRTTRTCCGRRGGRGLAEERATGCLKRGEPPLPAPGPSLARGYASGRAHWATRATGRGPTAACR